MRRTTKRLTNEAFETTLARLCSVKQAARLQEFLVSGAKATRFTENPQRTQIVIHIRQSDDWGLLYSDGIFQKANGAKRLTYRIEFLHTAEEIAAKGLKNEYPTPEPKTVTPTQDVSLREQVIEELVKTGKARPVAAQMTVNPIHLKQLAMELELI